MVRFTKAPKEYTVFGMDKILPFKHTHTHTKLKFFSLHCFATAKSLRPLVLLERVTCK